MAQPLPQPIVYGSSQLDYGMQGQPNVTLFRLMRRRCAGRRVRGQQRTAWMCRSSADGQKTTTPTPYSSSLIAMGRFLGWSTYRFFGMDGRTTAVEPITP
ncbi:hypothetical protein PG993_004904 [Apiospora rasikravindrae]|uniref:Uncharacterized protein n=1 Tax=Apiospora rasikravindrae TaxID=990691 RepID=A0ABR1TE38_9PEZI